MSSVQRINRNHREIHSVFQSRPANQVNRQQVAQQTGLGGLEDSFSSRDPRAALSEMIKKFMGEAHQARPTDGAPRSGCSPCSGCGKCSKSTTRDV